jgi:hypothetical protein
MKRYLTILLGSLAALATSQAHDHSNLESGIPLEVEDSYAAPWLNREVQLSSYFERTAEGKDHWLVEPRLEFGLPVRNAELTTGFPFEMGEATDEDGLQNVNVELFYNFNTEGRYLPAFAVSGEAAFPVGGDPEGVDTKLELIATRTIGYSTLLHRFYLNAAWLHNDEAEPLEREDRFKLVAGYAMRATADLFLLADYVHEQELERGVTSNMAEIGLRYMLTPRTVVALGAAAGLDDESPDFRVRFGLQWMF